MVAGQHVIVESDLFDLTVARFKTSTRRPELWASLMQFCEELRDAGLIPCRLWIDGSFLTEKVDPDDIDLVVEASHSILDKLAMLGEPILQTINQQELHAEPRSLHTFLLATYPVMHREFRIGLEAWKYWVGAFGFALISRQPKGIAVLEVGP